MKEKPDIIAFDLDGTLTQPGKAGRLAARYAENVVAAGLMLAHRFYETARTIKNAVCPDVHLSPSFKKAVLSKISGPRSGVAEMTAQLREQGIKIVLISNNSRYAWGERLARHLDFGPGFDTTIYREDMKGRLKPDPQALLRAVNEMGDRLASLNVWIVGDMGTDMQLADNASAQSQHKFVPVAMGETSMAAAYLMTRSGGDGFIIKTCAQLIEALEARSSEPHILSAPAASRTAPVRTL